MTVLILLYLILLHALPCIMLMYLLVITGKPLWKDNRLLHITVTPYAMELVFLCTSPFTRLAFYIENGVYYHGKYFFLVYLCGLLYIAVSFLTAILSWNFIPKRRLVAVLSFIPLQLTAIAIQYRHPQYLLIPFAAALSLLILLISLHSSAEYSDSLTLAYNRPAMLQLAAGAYSENRSFRIFGYSLVSFSRIYSLYGEACGDELLLRIVRVLNSTFGGITARIDGDKFCVFIDNSVPDEQILQLAENLPTVWRHRDYEISFVTSKALLDSRDFSSGRQIMEFLEFMFRCGRENGCNHTIVIDEALKYKFHRRQKVQCAIQRAISEKRISVVYQPVVDARTGRIVAAEALARLDDPEIGQISPEEFIPMAEQEGLILELGALIRSKVCEFLAEYDILRAGLSHISVNLSVVECTQRAVVEAILSEEQKYGTERGIIRFEVTETSAVDSPAELAANMEMLCAKGFAFHLDDYGTGYSSMFNLISLPFSAVKIDKSVLSLSESSERGDLIKRMIAPFHGYGIEVVCEGVETEKQAQMVRSWGVDYIQGYLYAKPLSAEEFAKFAGIEKRPEKTAPLPDKGAQNI